MKEKLKIVKVRDGSFDGEDGRIEYWWIKALRLSDGITLEFGSKTGGFEVGEEVEVLLEKTEFLKKNGQTGFRYKEIE